MIYYLDFEGHFPEIFRQIRKYHDKPNDPVPNYEDEKRGMSELKGILERIKDDYYSDFFIKSAYLFCGITEGHYFSNGNKRLAMMSFVSLYKINDYKEKPITRAKYATKIKSLFPMAKLSKISEIPEVFPEMIYHLCKIVADKKSNQCNFDQLKEKIEDFFRFSLY